MESVIKQIEFWIEQSESYVMMIDCNLLDMVSVAQNHNMTCDELKEYHENLIKEYNKAISVLRENQSDLIFIKKMKYALLFYLVFVASIILVVLIFNL